MIKLILNMCDVFGSILGDEKRGRGRKMRKEEEGEKEEKEREREGKCFLGKSKDSKDSIF